MTWQPIETAPKDKRILFLAYGDTVYLGEWCEVSQSWRPEFAEVPMFDDPDSEQELTHWMPLPELPEIEEDWRSEAIHLGI